MLSNGFDLGWAEVWLVVLLVGLVVLLWGLVQARRAPKDRSRAEADPQEILRERFARGEITDDELRERLKALRHE